MSDSEPSRSVYERRLTSREVSDWLATPISAAEVANVEDLVRWFTGRYPTARQRLAYARRAYSRWTTRRARGGKV